MFEFINIVIRRQLSQAKFHRSEMVVPLHVSWGYTGDN